MSAIPDLILAAGFGAIFALVGFEMWEARRQREARRRAIDTEQTPVRSTLAESGEQGPESRSPEKREPVDPMSEIPHARN